MKRMEFFIAVGAVIASLVGAGSAGAAAHRVQVEGTVASVATNSFVVHPRHGANVTVDTSAATAFRKNDGTLGSFTDIEAGAEVNAQGTRNSDGSVNATRVVIQVVQHVGIQGVIVSGSASSFVVQRANRVQETVTTDANTDFRNNDGTAAAAGDVAAGKPVAIWGIQIGTDTIAAKKVLFIVVQPVEMEGTVDTLSLSGFDLLRQGGLHVAVTVDSNTLVRKADGTVGSFADVTLQAHILVRGDQSLDGSVLARTILLGVPTDLRGLVTGVNNDGSFAVQAENHASTLVRSTASTSFRKNDGTPATPADVTVGTNVAVHGPAQNDGSLLADSVVLIVAHHVEAEGTVSDLTPPVSGDPTQAGSLVLQTLGGVSLTVDTSNSTNFRKDDGTHATFADLALGQDVIVNGVPNADGSLQAAGIILVVKQSVRVEGPVLAIDAGTTSLTVQRAAGASLVVHTDANTTFTKNDGTTASFSDLSTSEVVSAVGLQNADLSLQATQVVIHTLLRFEGIITGVNGTTLTVRRSGGLSVTVTTDSSTQFKNNDHSTFTTAELRPGADLLVTGTPTGNASVAATQVVVVVGGRHVTIAGTIAGVSGTSFTVHPLHGADLVVNELDTTTYRNSDGSAFVSTEIAAGAAVTVHGIQNADGSLTATTVNVVIRR